MPIIYHEINFGETILIKPTVFLKFGKVEFELNHLEKAQGKLIYSPLFLKIFESIITYLQYKFGQVAVSRFMKSVDNKINLFTSRPAMFMPSRIK